MILPAVTIFIFKSLQDFFFGLALIMLHVQVPTNAASGSEGFLPLVVVGVERRVHTLDTLQAQDKKVIIRFDS